MNPKKEYGQDRIAFNKGEISLEELVKSYDLAKCATNSK